MYNYVVTYQNGSRELVQATSISELNLPSTAESVIRVYLFHELDEHVKDYAAFEDDDTSGWFDHYGGYIGKKLLRRWW